MHFLSRIRYATILIPFLLFTSCDVLHQVTGAVKDASLGLSNEQIVSGLKEALKVGAEFASNNASQTDGFLNNPLVDIRIPLPPKLQKVENNIRKIPLVGDKVADNLITAMNRGAEKAAKKAAPIFINAITSMSIQDASGILRGGDNAATSYLERTTSSPLRQAFRPVIKKALDEVNATDYYNALKSAISTFNKTPLVNKINVNVKELPALDEYATDKALEGLFTLVAREEKNIRDNPLNYSQDIIRKVFSQQKAPTYGGGL